ncbi:MAG TPA: DNA polymerase III subunit gamma/tau [Candidatus Mucispirillum faecigallinarum]|uniref:DNA polymerase III subunit gamma/tau n=1 Tax=Candidatus Mucispirillum faecigallinarum TaxID=2838699 RepID=A0A9D2GTH3_9BACT|nr:DNA polymerase III subunit gamma/tau [Candidatus Mucispirillum faecigallinarum]
MSYLALARKYRPQTFSEVLSQDFITSTLQNAITMGRVAHAYLFTGPRGVGKTSTARIFAKALNCMNPNGAAPCGECDNCLEITNGTSLDVIEIDGASNRGVEEIRSLREAVKFVPVKSKYKVIIVDEVHMLTEQAFNALLKTLEEPPEYVIFIFATTDQHKIPVTILSRCQRYEFKKITYEEMNSNLKSILEKENITYEDDALNYIIRNSDGCMRDALSLLDQIIAYGGGKITLEDTSYLLGITDAYLSNDIFSAVLKEETELLPDLVNQIDEKGIDYKYMTECLIEHCRNMMIYGISDKLPRQDMTKNEEEYYSSLKKYADKPRLYALFQILTKLINDLKYSDFARYVFEFAVIKASNISSIINILEGKNNMPVSSAPKMQSYQNSTVSSANISKPVTNIQETKEETVNNIKGSDSGIWIRILNIVSSKYPMLYGMLQYAKLIKDTDEHLVITFPQDRQFQYRQLKTGNLKDTFENTVWTVSEKHTKIDIELEKELEDSKKKADIEDTAEKKNYKIESDINQENIKTAQVKKVQSDKIESFAVHTMKEEVKDNNFLKMAEKELGCHIINIEKN